MPEPKSHKTKTSISKKKTSKNVKVPQPAELASGTYASAVSSGLNGIDSEANKLTRTASTFIASLPSDTLHTHLDPYQRIASLYEPDLQHDLNSLGSPRLITAFSEHSREHDPQSPLPPLPSTYSGSLRDSDITFGNQSLKRTFDEYISGYSPPPTSAELSSTKVSSKVEKDNPGASESPKADTRDGLDGNGHESTEKERGGNGRPLVKTKRAEQNRLAQQAHRQRKQHRAKELEDKEKLLEQYIAKEEQLIAREQQLLVREQQLALKQEEGGASDSSGLSKPAAKPPDRTVEALQKTIADLTEQLSKSNTTLEELIKTKSECFLLIMVASTYEQM